MAEKKSSKETQRHLLNKYTKADCEIDETTSWPDGLHETSKFLPYLPRPLRRTDSFDDIERYKLYFSLARKNQRYQLTWKSYCDILLDDLRDSDIAFSLKKMSIQPSCTPSTSENFPRAAKSVSSLKKIFENDTPKNKRPFVDIDADVESLASADAVKSYSPSKIAREFSTQPSCTPIKQEPAYFPLVATSVTALKKSYENPTPIKRLFMDIDADVESVSSWDDKFLTPSKNALKRMCTEIRTLAQKTCKTVEKMTSTTKYCSTCGDIMRSATFHKKCAKQRADKYNYNTPVTSGLFGSSNPVEKRPMIFQSPTITTSNAYLVDPRIKKLQRKPFFRS